MVSLKRQSTKTTAILDMSLKSNKLRMEPIHLITLKNELLKLRKPKSKRMKAILNLPILTQNGQKKCHIISMKIQIL